jgi:hypothetical protein
MEIMSSMSVKAEERADGSGQQAIKDKGRCGLPAASFIPACRCLILRFIVACY